MAAGPTTWQASSVVNTLSTRDTTIDALVSALKATIGTADFPAAKCTDVGTTDNALIAAGLMKAA